MIGKPLPTRSERVIRLIGTAIGYLLILSFLLIVLGGAAVLIKLIWTVVFGL